MVNSETIRGRSPSALPVGLHDVGLTRDEYDERASVVLATAFEVTQATPTAPESDSPATETAPDKSSGCSTARPAAGVPALAAWLVAGLLLSSRRRRQH